MRRALVGCVLLNLIVSASPWRSDAGRLNCHSYSHPLFGSTSWTRHPCYPSASSCGIRVKPILNLLIDDPPPIPIADTYTPDPFEVTEKTSKILHKLHTVAEDFQQITKEFIQIHTYMDESEEELPGYQDDEEVPCNGFEIDIRESKDDSREEDMDNIFIEDDCNDASDEEHDNRSVVDIEIRIRSKI